MMFDDVGTIALTMMPLHSDSHAFSSSRAPSAHIEAQRSS